MKQCIEERSRVITAAECASWQNNVITRISRCLNEEIDWVGWIRIILFVLFLCSVTVAYFFPTLENGKERCIRVCLFFLNFFEYRK